MLGRIEDQLIDDLIKELKNPASLRAIEAGDFENWKISQLKALNEYRKRNKHLYTKRSEEELMEKISATLKRTYGEGADAVRKEAMEAIAKGYKGIKSKRNRQALLASFNGINDRKLQSLIDTANGNILAADKKAVQYAESAYSKILFDAQSYYESGSGTLAKSIDMATKDLFSKGIVCVEYKNGARTDIRTYSEMVLRTVDKQSYMQGEAKMRDEIGVNTVIVTRRGNACPKCMQFVGKVFFDDVYGSGGENNTKYPLLSSAIAGGLYHPNCRDVHTTYFEGVTTQRPAPTEEEKREAARVYNLEQEQRYNERQIRKYDRLRKGTFDEEQQKKYESLHSAWKKKNKELVDSNPELKRKYERERAYKDPEGKYIPTTHSKRTEAQISPSQTISTKKKEHKVVKTFLEAEDALENDIGFVKLGDINRLNKDLVVVNTNQLIKLEDTFGAIKQSERPDLITRSSGNAVAYVSHSVVNPKKQTLSLCKSYYGESTESFLATHKRLVSNGFFMPIKDELENYYIYSVTHEYGHILHNILIQKEFDRITQETLLAMGNIYSPNSELWTKGHETVAANYMKKIIKEIEDIARAKNPKYSRGANISRYGKTNVYEFFAEVFANSQLGAPNELGSAMNEWLKKKGLIL